tara:strand:- start:1012 stop:1245 length:234 start_codon:yes stop_codon:yes gene_type:complete
MATKRRCLICRKVKPIDRFPTQHDWVCDAVHPETWQEDPRESEETAEERQERKIAEAEKRGDALPILSGLMNDIFGS